MTFASMPLQWIKDHIEYPHEYCLIWPFGRDGTTGRGSLQYEGRSQYAHRIMCLLAHGEPPTSAHQAAHSCGNGHLGCANPSHLEWKTISENHMDTSRHGRWTYVAKKLTAEQVAEIRALQGKELQRSIAERYGVSAPTISHIWYGRTHTAVQRAKRFTPEEDEAIRDGVLKGMSFPELAARLDRPKPSVVSRAYRLGLNSGFVRGTASR